MLNYNTITLFLFGLLLLPLFELYIYTTNNMSFATALPRSATSATPKTLSDNDILLSELFNIAKDSVVQLSVTHTQSNPHIIVNGTPLENTNRGRGSGFVYDDSGRIVTNVHVIRGAKIIEARFLDGNSYGARILGQDLYSDLAILQLDRSSLEKQEIKPLPIGNSSAVRVGQQVVTIGNPLGLTGSMTEGIVSQVKRVHPDAITGKFFASDLIQTDAPITSGNSGGPLLNTNGEVIGVTKQSETDPDNPQEKVPGISYAIPSNKLKKIAPELIANGTYKHPWLGIRMIDISPDIALEIGLEEAKGVMVSSVTPGSPAQLAGIESGKNGTIINSRQIYYDADIILGIDKNIVRDSSDLINYIDSMSPGDEVALELSRNNGAIQTLNVKLAERP